MREKQPSKHALSDARSGMCVGDEHLLVMGGLLDKRTCEEVHKKEQVMSDSERQRG